MYSNKNIFIYIIKLLKIVTSRFVRKTFHFQYVIHINNHKLKYAIKNG